MFLPSQSSSLFSTSSFRNTMNNKDNNKGDYDFREDKDRFWNPPKYGSKGKEFYRNNMCFFSLINSIMYII
jgi:hypothetical protein